MYLTNNSVSTQKQAFQKWNGGTIDSKAAIHKRFSRSNHRSKNGTPNHKHKSQ